MTKFSSLLPPYHCEMVYMLRKMGVVPRHGFHTFRRGVMDSLRIY